MYACIVGVIIGFHGNELFGFVFLFFPGNKKGLLLRKPQSEFEISIYIYVCLVFVLSVG